MGDLFICAIIVFAGFNSYGQKFEVPEEVLSAVKSKQFDYTHTATFNYKVVYPVNYDSLATYKVLLGLSGGNASDEIVNYCYYTLFDSNFFDNYITILPLGPSGRSLAAIDSTEINLLISDVMGRHKVTEDNWIVAGTSMGGFASFNFASVRPELFEGIITFPGGLRTEEIPKEWAKYRILLAIGELDEENWTSLIEETKLKLEGKVRSLETFIMKGQEHIVSPEYKIDEVYARYFTEEK